MSFFLAVGEDEDVGMVVADWCPRPGTAMLFALTIVEQLAGKDKKEEVMGPMMCAESL